MMIIMIKAMVPDSENSCYSIFYFDKHMCHIPLFAFIQNTEIVVGVKKVDLNILETADVLGFSPQGFEWSAKEKLSPRPATIHPHNR